MPPDSPRRSSTGGFVPRHRSRLRRSGPVENLVITNGYGDYGGGARFIASSDVVVRNCHFRNNHANWDGGGAAHEPEYDTHARRLRDHRKHRRSSDMAGPESWRRRQRLGATLTLVRTRVCGNIDSSTAGLQQITGVNEEEPIGFGACIQSDCAVCVTTEPSDLNFDGRVDGADMTILLSAWGDAGPGDLDGSGLVDGGDRETSGVVELKPTIHRQDMFSNTSRLNARCCLDTACRSAVTHVRTHEAPDPNPPVT